MITLGAGCLILAFAVALYAGVAALAGTRGDRRFVDSSRRAVYAFAGLLTICVVIIEAAFARTDLSLQVVADHSSTTTPAFYRLTAMWSSQEGSLLLWAWVLALTSSADPVARARGRPRTRPSAAGRPRRVPRGAP